MSPGGFGSCVFASRPDAAALKHHVLDLPAQCGHRRDIVRRERRVDAVVVRHLRRQQIERLAAGSQHPHRAALAQLFDVLILDELHRRTLHRTRYGAATVRAVARIRARHVLRVDDGQRIRCADREVGRVTAGRNQAGDGGRRACERNHRDIVRAEVRRVQRVLVGGQHEPVRRRAAILHLGDEPRGRDRRHGRHDLARGGIDHGHDVRIVGRDVEARLPRVQHHLVRMALGRNARNDLRRIRRDIADDDRQPCQRPACDSCRAISRPCLPIQMLCQAC